MRAFRDVVSDCPLQDLGWSGVPYTWDNRQSGNANVKARLNRAFANEEFRQKYEHAKVLHVYSLESDHCFVVVDLRCHPSNRHASKPSRYENIWQSHRACLVAWVALACIAWGILGECCLVELMQR